MLCPDVVSAVLKGAVLVLILGVAAQRTKQQPQSHEAANKTPAQDLLSIRIDCSGTTPMKQQPQSTVEVAVLHRTRSGGLPMIVPVG